MTDPGEHPGLGALAEAMRARIEHLGLTQLEIGDRGGPQRAAIREILETRRLPRSTTLAKIDVVLGWPEGTARGLLDQTREIPAPDEWIDLADQNRLGVVRSGLLQLRKDHYRLSDHYKHAGDELTALINLLDEHTRHG